MLSPTWFCKTVTVLVFNCYGKSMKENGKKKKLRKEKNQTSRTCIDFATFERGNLLAHSRVQFSYVQRTIMIQDIFHQPTYDYLYE
jgi:hypothetical protein